MGGVSFAFVLPVTMLILGGTFLLIWRAGLRPALLWGLGFLCSGIGFAVPLLLETVPPPLQAVLADTAFAGAFLFYNQALLADFGQASRPRLPLAVAALAVVLSLVAVFGLNSLEVELAASDFSCATLLGLAMARVAPRVKHPVDRWLFVVTGLVGLETAAQGCLAVLTTAREGLDAFATSDYAFFMQASASVLGLVFALSVLASMANRILAASRAEASTDALTGLLNRRGFERAVASEARLRQGSIITCDIDRFKQVNDRFGHTVGDMVIAEAARVLRTTLPDIAAVARFGGEEFVICIPAGTLAEANSVAQSLKSAFIGNDWARVGVNRALTASFGLSVAHPGDASVYEAISRADRGLYDAKRSGRNRVSVRFSLAS